MLTLTAVDTLSACPECGADDFARVPLFSHMSQGAMLGGVSNDDEPTDEPGQETMRHGGALSRPEPSEHEALLSAARAQTTAPGRKELTY